ncbi:LysR family transcriptional regulator [Arthrobacter sp. MYb211]|uniref:LysR family transcriptional regulator n=1 Tax=Micrococcaceae TaxID=1268 RepID=UPI000BB86970|nr:MULTISPECIES: LysR family transcriptional regulator [Micrococcaceae]PCC27114.1 LysR family transcriptional regulator [Glutamicibacter sp. BW80]PQZ97279.1 LysR family transcriptional regulator [Arthrobacter sp. MYb224]PRA00931.1 LysR family transcriptional regulator [Arthrobacter sp. MYb229]PRA10877.1 LysR family transcriptional regulator [Arthrobacter sp. MYb221]PRB48866.1 LysR family transcriptional regulator [Arthrobacter sp. MYb216]
MDVRQLRYFLAVVDHEGFNRAAEHLLIAQPSLSQTIKSLEREIGLPLFHRVGRRAVLSEAGKELVGPARLVVRDLDAAHSAMSALKGVRRGRLELIAMPSPAIEPLTTLIAGYTERYPQISVSTAAAFTVDDVVSSVRNGSNEIGLLGADRPITAPGVDVVQLERQPLMLIINPTADNFGAREVLSGQDLGGERVIISQRGSLMRALVDDLLAGGVNIEIVAEVAHRTSILPLVLAGVGHAILPVSWAPLARRSGLRVTRLEPVAELHVAIISRQSNLTPAARAFLSVAEAYAASSLGHHS